MIQRILVSLLAAAALLSGDTLVLRDGSRIDGVFVSGDNHSIRFAVGNQVNTYYLNDIESVRFNGAPPASPGPASTYSQNPNPPQPPPQERPLDTYPARPSAPPVNGPAGLEVPAGTALVVRLIDPVDSERDRLGQTYRASIDQPVVVNGQTAIPRGSDVIATLIDAQKSGKIEGRTILTLDLKSITVNGRTYEIVTTGVPEASGSRGARSGKVIGGTAALVNHRRYRRWRPGRGDWSGIGRGSRNSGRSRDVGAEG